MIRFAIIVIAALIVVGILMVVSRQMNKFTDEEAEKRFKESLDAYQKLKEGNK